MKVGDKVRYIGEDCPEVTDKVGVIVEAYVPVYEGTMHKVDFDEYFGYTLHEYNLELIPEQAPTQPTFKPGARVRYNHSFSCTPTYPDLVGKEGYVTAASDETKMAEVSFEGRVERIAWVNLELIEEPVEEEAEVEGEVELKVGHLIMSPEGFYGTMREVDFAGDRFIVEWEGGNTYGQTYGYALACRERYLKSVEAQPPIESLVKEVEPEVELKVGDLVLDTHDQLGLIDRIAGDYDIIIDWRRDGKMYHSRASTEYWRKRWLESMTEEPQVRSEQTDGAIPPDFFEDPIDYVGSVFDGTTEPFDEVNKASHYNQGQFEVIRVLEDWLSPEEYRGFCRGNVLKYTARYNEKGGEKDLKKARYYLDELIRVESCIV